MITVDPAHYSEQLAEKTAHLAELLRPYAAPPAEVFASPASHYRMRAEFRFWHEGEDAYYAMTGSDKNLVRIDHFPVACERINTLMQQLLPLLRNNPQLRKNLFQVEFLATTTGDCVITLAYHRRLNDEWKLAATSLQDALSCAVIGRSRGQKITLSHDFVEEQFSVNGEVFSQRQPESAFSQPNAAVNTQMLAWACRQCPADEKDLLELYCGNGNFTLPLSRRFRRVLATEVSKAAVAALQHNVIANNCSNIGLARLSSEELTQALNGERPFRRLAHLQLDEYDFSTVLVDPPRAGLDPATLALVQRFDNILYISCNPATLVENLAVLHNTHTVEAAALFDQFPYTHHMEAGVFLQRKKP